VNDRIRVVPVAGRLIRKLDRTPLAAAGEMVDDDTYWRRLERDGDVTIEPIAADVESESLATTAEVETNNKPRNHRQQRDAEA